MSLDENNTYETYQASFSHILHQTKSLDVICKENKLQSILVLKPNTSIVTVRQLPYRHLCYNDIHRSMMTSYISVRLIAYQTDLSIQCDLKPMKCKNLLDSFPNKCGQNPSVNNIIKSTLVKDKKEKKS